VIHVFFDSPAPAGPGVQVAPRPVHADIATAEIPGILLRYFDEPGREVPQHPDRIMDTCLPFFLVYLVTKDPGLRMPAPPEVTRKIGKS
jgi:hypothetical protein